MPPNMKPPSIDEIYTPRLHLVRIRDSDLADLCRMYVDERVTATLGGLRSEEQTRELLGRHLAHWEEHGFGRWVARDRATAQFAGRGGLQRMAVGGREEVEG